MTATCFVIPDAILFEPKIFGNKRVFVFRKLQTKGF